MTPILMGRLQTRIFAVAVIGGIWTLIITPFLPAPAGVDVGYDMTFGILVVVGVAGLGWELIYHALQQFRWEKDWPTGLGLVTGINEGILLWFLVDAGLAPAIDEGGVPGGTFLWHFVTTWVVIFLFLAGPMRVPFVRWRFKGGRLI